MLTETLIHFTRYNFMECIPNIRDAHSVPFICINYYQLSLKYFSLSIIPTTADAIPRVEIIRIRFALLTVAY